MTQRNAVGDQAITLRQLLADSEYNFLLNIIVLLLLLRRMGKIVDFSKRFSNYELLISLFASLQLNWVSRTGRLLGPVACLPHKNGGIS